MAEEHIVKEIGFHYLFSSTLFVSKEPCHIQTVLGSCVAVCLYDQRLKFGGMNHYMMPLWNGKGLASPNYGNIAIDMLLEKMMMLGSQNKNLIAKVFGGANQHNFNSKIVTVGERNIEVAKNMLKGFSIHVVAESTGGTQGRKIAFDTFTGQVSMKYLMRTNAERVRELKKTMGKP